MTKRCRLPKAGNAGITACGRRRQRRDADGRRSRRLHQTVTHAEFTVGDSRHSRSSPAKSSDDPTRRHRRASRLPNSVARKDTTITLTVKDSRRRLSATTSTYYSAEALLHHRRGGGAARRRQFIVDCCRCRGSFAEFSTAVRPRPAVVERTMQAGTRRATRATMKASWPAPRVLRKGAQAPTYCRRRTPADRARENAATCRSISGAGRPA